VELPHFGESERLFVSIANFPGQETGDLSFAEGKIVVDTCRHGTFDEYEINYFGKNVKMWFLSFIITKINNN